MNLINSSCCSTLASSTDNMHCFTSSQNIWEEWVVDLARDITNSSSITFSELNEMPAQSESLCGHVDVIVLTADDDVWQLPDIPPSLNSFCDPTDIIWTRP